MSRSHFRFFPFFLLILALVGCETNSTILNNVSEREANEIIVLLASKGIPATKSPAPTTAVGGTAVQTWDIQVPAQNITEAISLLNQAGLPRVKGTSLLDLFGTSGLVPSDLQDKIRYQEGLSEQIANTIRKMDGVVDANVQIMFPQDENAANNALTASVYIKHRGVLDNPNSILVTKIKRLVASSVNGLSIDNVAVVSDRALSDIVAPATTTSLDTIKNYVSIWGINVSQDSVVRFRLIFYFFLLLLFVILSLLVWILWKVFPLLERRGGVKALMTPEQIGEVTVETPPPPEAQP